MSCKNCGSEDELSKRGLCKFCEDEEKQRIRECKPE